MTFTSRFLHRSFAPQVLAARSATVVSLCAGTFLVFNATAPLAQAETSTAKPNGQRVLLAQAQTNKPAAAPNPGQRTKPGDTGVPEGTGVPVGPEDATPNPDPGLPAPEKPATPDTPTGTTPDAGVSVLNPPVPGGETPPTPGGLRATEAEGLEIADVRVVGNRIVPAQSVLLQATSRRGAAFSTLQVDRDRQKIDSLGFFAGVQYQVTPNLDDPKKVDLTFIVVENRVVNGFSFKSLDTTAPLRVKDEDLIAVLQSKTGAVLNNNTVNGDVKRVQDLFKERGYAVLVVDAGKVDEKGILNFVVQQARISRIDFAGLSKTKPSIVRKQLRVKAGDIFDQVLLRRDLNRIYDLGFFDDVTYKIVDDAEKPGSLILTISLKEKRTGQLTFGVGFDSRSKLTGYTALSENNLRGTGKRAYATVELGAQQTFDVGYGDPFIGKNNASYDVNVFSRRVFRQPRLVSIVTGQPVTNAVSYQEQRTGGRLNYGVPLDQDRTRKYLLGYRNESAKLQQVDINGNTQPVTSLQQSGRVAAFSAGFLRDRRDLQLDPSRGGREQILLEQAASIFGGNQSFTKLDLDVRRYYPLIGPDKVGELPKVVLANRFVIGQSFGQLPPFEQYFVGGSETVRGYDVDAQLGDNQVYNNFEVRYRFQKKLTLVGFVDAGRASGGRFANDDSILYSIGGGVRFQTPIGPIRFDVGFGRDGARTHFAIGPTF